MAFWDLSTFSAFSAALWFYDLGKQLGYYTTFMCLMPLQWKRLFGNFRRRARRFSLHRTQDGVAGW
jgi:hypothetical protein